MTAAERYQLERAESARRWLASPEYARELRADTTRREALDVALRHSPKCSLSRCHPDCPRIAR